jgi:hypothetical protein
MRGSIPGLPHSTTRNRVSHRDLPVDGIMLGFRQRMSA